MRFWDSSALVPLLTLEPASAHVRRLLRDDPLVSVWWAAPVECASALARRDRETTLSGSTSKEAYSRLDELRTGWQEIHPTEAIRATAMRLVRVHPLRAADALQLAAALAAAEADPSALPFVTLDERLAGAADREGFRLEPL